MTAHDDIIPRKPRSIVIREVGPREGFQILPSAYPTAEKLRLIGALIEAGLKSIEVTSFVRADRLPQMADAEQVAEGLPRRDDVSFKALYLNVKGFERAEATKRFDNEGWLYTATSDAFLKANTNSSVDQGVEEIPEWLAAFHRAGKTLHGLMISTAFGCSYEGKASTSALVKVIKRFVDACAPHANPFQEVCLADTIGRGTPLSVAERVKAVRDLGLEVSLHLHDTWGMGLVNVYAGLEAGVSIFETSIAGLGGCPFTPGAAGNVATEEVVYLCHSLGLETGIDLDLCYQAAKVADEIVGKAIKPGATLKG